MDDWKNLARWLATARGSMTQPEVAQASGVSLSTIQKYEAGRAQRGGRMLRKLADYYGWTSDSIAVVLAGGRPTAAEPDALSAFAQRPTEPALKEVLLQAVEAYPASETTKRHLRRKIQAMPED